MKYLRQDTVATGHTGYQQQVKEANIKHIFDLVRSGRCKSRAELVREMKLSATSVSVLVEELTDRGLIVEKGPKHTSLPGRRPISLSLNSDSRQIAVFTLQRGGVRYCLLNLACHILESLFIPLEAGKQKSEDPAEEYIRLFEDILEHRSQRFDPSRALVVGISFPGVYIHNDRLFCTEAALGVSLPEEAILRFQQRIHLPVYLFSGTRSKAYAEKKLLDAASPETPATLDMLFVEIRERISCAIITNGDVYTGPYNVAGEIGHFTIDYNGKPCRCGNTGCLERYVNLDAILEDARAVSLEAGIDAPDSLEALAERYPNEPALLASVQQSARLLAFGLYSGLCSSGMRRIVLGGGIEILGEGFLREVYRAICARSLMIRRLDLSYARTDENTECVGLAQHFLDKVYTITG